MGTKGSDGLVGTTLFGKTQRGLLSLFFLRPEQSYYLRQIVRTAKIGQGAAQRELAKWTESGLLLRTQRGNQVVYQANPASPVFAELRSLAVKTVGVADVLREALASSSGLIDLAFIHGSMVRGTETSRSDVDLVIVGDVSFGEIVSTLQVPQEKIGREVNPTVYPRKEFRAKILGKHHFVTSVIESPKIFLVGNENELERLGAQQVAGRTPD